MTTHGKSDGVESPLASAATAVRNSVLIKIATAGAGLILLAVGIELAISFGLLVRGLSGTIAAIVFLWGIGLLVTGTAARTVVWWRRR